MQTQSKSIRLLSAFLAFLLVMGVIPLQIIPAQAAGTTWSLSSSEIGDGDEVMFLNSKTLIADVSQFENYGKDAGGYQGVTDSYWATPYITSLVYAGVLRGVTVNEKYYMPTADPAVGGTNPDTCSEQSQVSGKDALALALLYYEGSKNSKTGVVSYSSHTRSDVYKNAGSYYNSAFNVSADLQAIINTSGRKTSSLYRSEAFVIIAVAAQSKSKGKVKLENYSSTKLGYMADDKTTVRGYDASSNSIDEKPIQSGDKSNYARYYGYAMQAANLLMDAGVMNGRTYYKDQYKCEIAFEGYITYAEFYKLLITAKSPKPPAPTQYSKVDAALKMTASSTPISYRDFLDGDKVTMTVKMAHR